MIECSRCIRWSYRRECWSTVWRGREGGRGGGGEWGKPLRILFPQLIPLYLSLRFSLSPSPSLPLSLPPPPPPTVPSAPLSLGYVDVGPESVIVVWLLSPDIGGAAIESVHVLYRTSDQLWGDALSKEIPVEPNANTHHEMSVKILNLKSNSQYQLRVMASNRVGASEPRVSVLFDTPPLGYPGSPSRVAVGNLSDTSASVSWVPSEIGRPFFGYEVIALREDSSVMEVRVSFKIEEVEKVVGGMEAALVRWYLTIAQSHPHDS